MPPNSAIRVGIAGFGRLAREYYVPILERMGGVSVTGVADPLDASRRASTRLLPSARTYSGVSDMCAREDLQALLVASPPSSHVEAWQAARDRGLSTFIEKPLGLVAQLTFLPQLSDADARVMVNFNRRFWPAYARCVEAVSSGQLGELQSIELTVQTNVHRWSTVTQHRLSAAEGGVLHDLGSQAVDVVCQIAGSEPTNISSAAGQSSGFEQVELQMQFASGANARCELGYGPANRENLVIVGSNARMVLREPNMAPHLLMKGERLRAIHYLTDYAALGYRFFAVRQRLLYYTMSKALNHFVDAVRTGKTLRPGYSEGVANLRLLARAAETMHASPAQVAHG